MHLIGPHIGALHRRLGVLQRRLDIALVDQFAWRGRVRTQGLLQIAHIGHAGPGLPLHPQLQHGLLGVLLAMQATRSVTWSASASVQKSVTAGHDPIDIGEVDYYGMLAVGKGKGNRCNQKKGRNNYWHKIVNKHGFNSQIVIDNLDEELALLCEQELISKYKFLKYNLANYTEGGEGISGYKHTTESKLKMSESQKKRFSSGSTWNKGIPCSDEIKNKLSKSHKGKDTWNKGKTGVQPKSLETKMKISQR